MSIWSVVKKILRGLAAAVLLVALAVAGLTVRSFRAARNVPVTTVEVIPPTEQDEILTLIRKATNVIAEMPRNDGAVTRDAHAKPHGCVMATMKVEDNLTEALRQGVFTEPGRIYQAWVRFSNGTMQDDREKDARGMAIKLMGVPGAKILKPEEDPEQGTQDFVMVNYHTFFLAELTDYEKFFDYQAANKATRYFTASRNPLDWKLREMVQGVRMLSQKVSTPLATQYYSMSAYRFGPHNIKFSAKPCREGMPPMPRSRGPNYLREALVSDLQQDAGCFHFLVQLQDPSKHMPIEDATIEWKQSESPYLRVATLEIPVQEFDTPEQNRFCENLQFTPFHAVPEQRPVGRMNRVRRLVYNEVSKRRHYTNQEPIGEPKGWCLDLTGATCGGDAEPSSEGR